MKARAKQRQRVRLPPICANGGDRPLLAGLRNDSILHVLMSEHCLSICAWCRLKVTAVLVECVALLLPLGLVPPDDCEYR